MLTNLLFNHLAADKSTSVEIKIQLSDRYHTFLTHFEN